MSHEYFQALTSAIFHRQLTVSEDYKLLQINMIITNYK